MIVIGNDFVNLIALMRFIAFPYRSTAKAVGRCNPEALPDVHMTPACVTAALG
jgi:hypothetical protein